MLCHSKRGEESRLERNAAPQAPRSFRASEWHDARMSESPVAAAPWFNGAAAMSAGASSFLVSRVRVTLAAPTSPLAAPFFLISSSARFGHGRYAIGRAPRLESETAIHANNFDGEALLTGSSRDLLRAPQVFPFRRARDLYRLPRTEPIGDAAPIDLVLCRLVHPASPPSHARPSRLLMHQADRLR
jgi:hypothetical protein